MEAYATRPRAVRPPAYFTETLPADTDGTAAIRWTPGRSAGSGVLVIESRRRGCTYLVQEFATPWVGRAAKLTKAEGCPGSDPESDGYEVFIGPEGTRCDCKGHERWGRCRHVHAMKVLILNGWLDLSPVNPDLDVTSTEPPF